MRFAAFLCLLFAMPSFAVGQGRPLMVAPGLTITSGTLPWAVEQYQDKPQLVPIHHSTVELNSHTGANIAGSLAGSFVYKPKLAGAHARTRLHSTTPVFYIFAGDDSDRSGDTDKSLTQSWAIVGALPVKDRRVFSKIQYTQLTGKAKRDDGNVRTQIESLGGGWYRLTPAGSAGAGRVCDRSGLQSSVGVCNRYL